MRPEADKAVERTRAKDDSPQLAHDPRWFSDFMLRYEQVGKLSLGPLDHRDRRPGLFFVFDGCFHVRGTTAPGHSPTGGLCRRVTTRSRDRF